MKRFVRQWTKFRTKLGFSTSGLIVVTLVGILVAWIDIKNYNTVDKDATIPVGSIAAYLAFVAALRNTSKISHGLNGNMDKKLQNVKIDILEEVEAKVVGLKDDMKVIIDDRFNEDTKVLTELIRLVQKEGREDDENHRRNS